MSIHLQIVTGLICGLVFGFFTLASSVNSKERMLLSSWDSLVQALNIRYMKLKNVLNFLKKHMNELHYEITTLIQLCDSAIDSPASISDIAERLMTENRINYKLEIIKTGMFNYPSLDSDSEAQKAIDAIIESEISVGEAIRKYNAINLDYKVCLDTFPFSFVGWLLNKNSEIIPFSVSMAEEFADNYIDEDKI